MLQAVDLSFFNPQKKTHINKLEHILPYVMFWRKLGTPSLHSKVVNHKVFTNELGKKFKEALLICVDDSYSNLDGSEYTKKYQVNDRNLAKIVQSATTLVEPAICVLVFKPEKEVNTWVANYYKKKYAKELAGEKQFNYNDKSYRLWNELQNLTSDDKQEVFGDTLTFDYDVSTSLISHMLGDVQKMDKKFDPNEFHLVIEYRDNKTEIRNGVSKLLDLPYEKVKELFSYINNNGVISTSPFMSLIKIVGNDKNKIEIIKKNKFFRKYRQQIKRLWRIWITMNNIRVWFRDDKERIHIQNKKRYTLYFFNERKLLDVIKSYLDANGFIYFLEHDGFRSNKEVNLDELHAHIASNLQVEIRLEQK
jgi:hypothetical protein